MASRAGQSIARSLALSLSLSRRLALVALVGALVLFSVVLVRTAWVCDDAYITFRTVDHLLHGYGPRWNVTERVQTYTHPLWMLILATAGSVHDGPYANAIALSLMLSVATAAIVAFRLSFSRWQATTAVLILAASRAFTDYSTSGLENPLSHFWIVCVCWALRTSSRPALPLLIGALTLLTRQDFVWLFGPALATHLWQNPRARRLAPITFGLSPLIAWETWSLVYYGFLTPNTAFAKLATGIPTPELVEQGLWYLRESFSHDPVTLAVIGASIILGVLDRWARPLAIGQIFYLCYVIWIGGDFMSGRFLSAPFLVGVVSLAARSIPVSGTWPVAIPAFVLAGVIALPGTNVVSDGHYGELRRYDEFHGITNERLYYYPRTGLLRTHHAFETPVLTEEGITSTMRAAGQTVATRDAVGMFGFAAGPALHVVDVLALCDPLLARLPTERPWRIGHFRRRLPDGYIQTLRIGQNVLVDPGLAAYYDELRLITRGELWTIARWRAIARMNLGRDNTLLRGYIASVPTR